MMNTHGKQNMTHTILIADDEPNMLVSLEFLMKREGYNVILARDGQEAMDVIVRDRPDLVLLDVMMPIKTGLEVCFEVRGHKDNVSKTPILMLSARSRDTDVAKGLALGANAYLTKPFSTKDLVTQVKAMLESQA
jgi:DNA-binding response OmpR family regulator